MQLELKPVLITCARYVGRLPMYTILENAQIVYCFPPVGAGEPGFVNAASVGCVITAVASHEHLDPAARQHFVLFTGLDDHFLGQPGHYFFTRVMYRTDANGPYAPLGGLFATNPQACPELVLALCRDWLGECPIQVTARSDDWVLPPRPT